MPNAKSKEETEMKGMVETWDGIQFVAEDRQVCKEMRCCPTRHPT